MIMAIILLVIAGAITGIKFSIGIELLIILGLLILTILVANRVDGLEGLFYYGALAWFVIGMLIGNVFVVFKYPSEREAFFEKTSKGIEWLFTPNSVIESKTNSVEKVKT